MTRRQQQFHLSRAGAPPVARSNEDFLIEIYTGEVRRIWDDAFRMAEIFARTVERGELDHAVDFITRSKTIFDVWHYAMLRHDGRPISADEVAGSVQRIVRMLLEHMRP